MIDPPTRQIHIGSRRLIETMIIGASSMGYKIHLDYQPYMHVTQEYPEMTELQRQFHRQLKISTTKKIQMAFCVSRSKGTYLAYRRILADFIVNR